MTVTKLIGAISAAAAALTLLAAPAAARPHSKRECHWERHHGHKVRVCHIRHWR